MSTEDKINGYIKTDLEDTKAAFGCNKLTDTQTTNFMERLEHTQLFIAQNSATFVFLDKKIFFHLLGYYNYSHCVFVKSSEEICPTG